MISNPVILILSAFLTFLIGFVITANKKYYSKIEREKRKKMKQIEFDPRIHKECNECVGTGIDFIAGPCSGCQGRGFVGILDE